jgi:hypothetical protein
MHILSFMLLGLGLLGFFIGTGLLLNRRRPGYPVDAARLFIWVWLPAAAVNSAVGYLQVGIPLINEIGAFAVIFGVPAAVALYLSRRMRKQEGTN